MSGLPKTGTGGMAIAIGGSSFYLPLWATIAVTGVAMVALGIGLVRVGWRRNKPVNAS